MGEVQKGRFVWYELMTTEPDRAEAFYSDVIGWNVIRQDMGGDVGEYSMFANGEVPGGDRVAQCMDPTGAAFALHSVAAG